MRRGARAVFPLAVAVVAFGLSYGVLARSAGMGVAAPIVMSATTFAGSAQFAVASVLDDAGGIAAAIAAAIMLNARYAPMSVAVAPDFAGPRWRRLFASQLIVDESWALAARPGGRFDVPFLLGAGLLITPSGSARPRSASSRATSSATPSGSASTPRFRRSSSPCSRARSKRDVPSPRRSQAARSRSRSCPSRRRGSRSSRVLPLPARPAPMSDVWLAVAVVGAATIAFNAVGPVLLGLRALPARLAGPIELLAPAVLAALVVTQLVGGDRELVFDERLAGIGVAVIATGLRAHLLAVVVVAALATALGRTL